MKANQRFTIDGSDELERYLARTCERVHTRVQEIIPPARIEGLVLGGGYGRGEGGVLHTPEGDRPYNDLEFYVFLRGSRLFNERKYAAALNDLGERLSPEAGLHVEFKIDSLARFRRSPVSMFSYDLVCGHRILAGAPDLLRGCEQHQHPRFPASDAARLLLNRCTGLLLAREILAAQSLTPGHSDFVGRNIAKAELALGDALLAIEGAYHWSCLERAKRLPTFCERGLPGPQPRPAWLLEIPPHHQAGVSFKLHPQRSARTLEEHKRAHAEVSALSLEIWLWVESRRLGGSFAAPVDYAFASVNKCSETTPWRNCLLNLRTFGYRGFFGAQSWRYPRERLFNSLPLLLWNGEVSNEPHVRRHLQRQLLSTSDNWQGLVNAYKKVWPHYG